MIQQTNIINWDHWDYGPMQVSWQDNYINISIGHPDYKFKLCPEQAQTFIYAIRSAITQLAHGIIYDISIKPGLQILVESPGINDSQENELFHDEYHLQIHDKQSHGFWLDKNCLLKMASEIEFLLNNNIVDNIMNQ